MNGQLAGLLILALGMLALVFLATALLDRCARLRAERDAAEADNIALRNLIRGRGAEPPPRAKGRIE